MAINIARRKFIATLGGTALAWPLAARAQQPNRMRHIGVLSNLAADDPEARARLAVFVQGLQEAGWARGRDVEIDTRWAAGDGSQYRKYAAELVALEPDVILAATTPAVIASQQASRTVPIVFVSVVDPVGSGLIASMSRPGGNSTGFVIFEYSLAAKWLQLLKEVAPGVTRGAVLRDEKQAAGIGQFAAIQTVAPIGLELSAVDLRDVGDTERAVAAFAQGSNGGLIVTASQFGANHPELIPALAARYKLPAIYPFRYFVSTGGLMSYGSDLLSEYRGAASYVDRILKGEKPAGLPVQAPTKYELAINLKTAKALGLTVPPSLLATADAVIE
jgi:putative tryptophan/tyrosine transport system substrate-binding protein